MKLIINSVQRNHRTVLMEYGSQADDLVILSPFLAMDVGRVLRDQALRQISRFRLLTALEPHSPFQINTVVALESVRCHFQKQPGVAWSVGIVDRLHGKVYLFSRKGEPFAAIVSSANFTASGLESNQEWGIACEDARLLGELRDSIAATAAREVDAAEIAMLYRRTQSYLKRARKHTSRIGLNLLRSLGPEMPVIGDKTRVWLKSSGWSKDPVRSGDDYYAKPEVELDFSKKRPSGVQSGDLVIVYGVGDRRLMGLFEVTGPPTMASEEEKAAIHWKPRWPWHIPAKNLALAYSKSWSAFDLRVRSLRDEYNSTHPGRPVTNAGSSGLGTLNRGNDKVRLHPDFARFLVDRLWTAQRSLITGAERA